MSKVIQFPSNQHENEEVIDLTAIEFLSDEQLFHYEKELGDAIISEVNEDDKDLLWDSRNDLVDEIERRYYELKRGMRNE